MILQATAHLLDQHGLPGRLSTPGARVVVSRLPGASPAAIAGALGRDRSAPVVLVAAGPGEADEAYADLRTLLDAGEAWYFPQREALPYEDADPHV